MMKNKDRLLQLPKLYAVFHISIPKGKLTNDTFRKTNYDTKGGNAK